MQWEALFKLFQSWGPTAISSLLVFVVLYLIKKIDGIAKKDEQRSEELRHYINETLNSFGARLSIVEKEYTKNENFYRELSGWKTEIHRLSDQITANFMSFTQHIIEVLTRGKI